MIVDSSASLVITSTTLTVEQITQHLGIEPSESRDIDDLLGAPVADVTGQPVQRRATEVHWRLDADAGGAHDSFSSLVALTELLRDKRDNLASLRPACTTVIVWGGFSDSDQGGFIFPATLLTELGGLGCDLHGTTYLEASEGDAP